MKWSILRNLISFWFFGLCTDFAYIVMLSGAEDIINHFEHKNSTALDYCEDKLVSRRCASLSTGAVLLADVIPTFLIKATIPFYMERVPIDVRHMGVVVVQFFAYILVAFALNITMALTESGSCLRAYLLSAGFICEAFIHSVVMASFSSGLGEVSYISFTSFFPRSAVATWASGTGGASLFGSLSYAGLTEPHFAGLSPKTTLMIMIGVPVLLALVYEFLLVMPKSIYRIKLYDPRTWITPQWYLDGEVDKKRISGKSKIEPEILGEKERDFEDLPVARKQSYSEYRTSQRQLSLYDKLQITLPLLPYMIALTTVYFAEYLMNQGIVELIIFDCSHGLHLAQTSQYRWYQVLYQAGVFISRSTSSFYEMPRWLLYVLPFLQLANATFFLLNAIYFFIPHIGIIFALILYEGMIGGGAYVNTFKRIYANAEPDVREFSLSVASLADVFGIVVAGFVAIPIHNFVCSKPLP